jgi:hypothetical protein
MNRVVIAAGFLAVSLACSAGHAVTVTDVAAFSRIADRFLLTVEVGTPGQADYRFIYSDRMGHVHVYAMDGDVLKMTWEVTTLGSRATAVIVSDLYGDGKLKLLISSSAGRVLIYDLATYELDWENQQLRYNRIDHMATAQLDGDRQLEVVVLADDPQMEIVLNSGIIVDSRFFNIQFQTDQIFGDRLALADLTGDGYPEVIGEFNDRSLRVFDVWRGREVW